jgi:A/G-specific adenine glycosylase
VSEVMLQQTQADRVVPKFTAFIRRFGSAAQLSKSSLSEVLTYWQGLGYNRRALYLKRAASLIVKDGFPRSAEALDALPGIGHYTARAILTFAHDERHIFLETNIKTVLIHHFFKKQKQISDQALLALLEQVTPHRRCREWYSALMDYGSMLKRTIGNVSRKSASYTKQSSFKGSNREIRGGIIGALLITPLSKRALLYKFRMFEKARVLQALVQLRKESLVEMRGRNFMIARSTKQHGKVK